MKIDLKFILSYAPLIVAIGITWGMFSARLDAVENKVDSVTQIQQDVAVIKEKIMWMEKYLIETNGK
jgi:hypothetical protein|tara:strand:- start:1535 stop:1735 length:201 start_codon:yes stop_codon:yes gene_type:complete